MPEVIGGFRVIEPLPADGPGAVFLAEDGQGRRARVALIDAAAEVRAGILARARSLAAIEHPAIARMLEYGELGEAVYLATSARPGRTLTDRLVERGPFDLAEALAISNELTSAIAALHRQGLTHGAIDPDHVEIDDKGRPRLAGLDRAALNEHADPRVDVRALAAVLFAMLTGVVHESASARLPALPAFVSPAPLGLATLLDRASDPEPSRRPADADAFLASLASIDLPRQPIPEQLAEVGSAARASTSPIWLAGLSMALLAIAALVAFILLAGRQ